MTLLNKTSYLSFGSNSRPVSLPSSLFSSQKDSSPSLRQTTTKSSQTHLLAVRWAPTTLHTQARSSSPRALPSQYLMFPPPPGLLSLLLFSTFSQDLHALCIFFSHTHTQTSKHPPRVLGPSAQQISAPCRLPAPSEALPLRPATLSSSNLASQTHSPVISLAPTLPSKTSLPWLTDGPLKLPPPQIHTPALHLSPCQAFLTWLLPPSDPLLYLHLCLHASQTPAAHRSCLPSV